MMRVKPFSGKGGWGNGLTDGLGTVVFVCWDG